MTSQIEAIWDAFSHKVVTVNGRPVPCTGLDNPPTALTSTMLPLRILHPFDDRAEGRDFHLRTTGPQIKGTWVIVDFCAFAPITAPPPLRAMLRYEVAYHDMMPTFRAAGGEDNPLIKAALQTWHSKQGVFEWPIGSQSYYHGVQIVFNIDEYPM